MEFTEKTQAVSASYRLIAGRILNRANDLFVAKIISNEQYNKASLQYLSLIQKAVDINMAAAHALENQLDVKLDEIEKATENLTKVSERLAKAAQIVELSGKIVAAAALVVAAIFDPTKVSAAAAAAAVLAVVKAISDSVPGE